MFNKLQNFKEQGYILVSRLKREDAIKAMKNVLDYFPNFYSNAGDESSYRRQFECFFHKLEKEYPNIFLMNMYGIQTLWKYIQCYKDGSLKDNLGIRKSALRIYEIIYYLYTCLPNFVGLDEMPTYNIDKKNMTTLAGTLLKATTENKIMKKVESGILLANDVRDGWNAYTIKKYYEGYREELEREFILKDYTRCYFEEILLQKCEEEIAKCNEGLTTSTFSSTENITEIFKGESE